MSNCWAAGPAVGLVSVAHARVASDMSATLLASLRPGILCTSHRFVVLSAASVTLVLRKYTLGAYLPSLFQKRENLGIGRRVSTFRSDLCVSSSMADVTSDNLNDEIVDIVRQIHGTSTKAVFYVAGGGVQVPSSAALMFLPML